MLSRFSCCYLFRLGLIVIAVISTPSNHLVAQDSSCSSPADSIDMGNPSPTLPGNFCGGLGADVLIDCGINPTGDAGIVFSLQLDDTEGVDLTCSTIALRHSYQRVPRHTKERRVPWRTQVNSPRPKQMDQRCP